MFDKKVKTLLLQLIGAAITILVSISMGKKVCIEVAREVSERPTPMLANPGINLPDIRKEKNEP